jgi:nicotinamidase-related amidase
MKKVLIVVDMQNDFINGALGSKEAVEIVDNVVNKIKEYEGKIIVTLDTHKNDYLETGEGKRLPVPHCIRMTEGWLLNREVLNALTDKDYKMIEKSTFGSIRLINEIGRIIEQDNYDNEIEIVGLCTDICVVSNALMLRSYYPETRISVDASCCAGVTPESHKAALLTMKSCQINVKGEE